MIYRMESQTFTLVATVFCILKRGSQIVFDIREKLGDSVGKTSGKVQFDGSETDGLT